MTRNYSFALKEHGTQCFDKQIKKVFNIDIFSPSRNGSVTIGLEVYLDPQEKIKIGSLRLSHHTYNHPEQLKIYFNGYFGFDDDKKLNACLQQLERAIEDSTIAISLGSLLWREFAEQFVNWFDRHIRSNIFNECRSAVDYFHQ